MHVRTNNIRTFSLDIGRLSPKGGLEALIVNGIQLELPSGLAFGLLHFQKDPDSRKWQVRVFLSQLSDLHQS